MRNPTKRAMPRSLRTSARALALGAILLATGASTAFAVQGSDGEYGDGCAIGKDWKSNLRTLNGWHAGPTQDAPICEPLVLVADAMHFIHLDLRCSGCEAFSNRFIEMTTNIKYRFVVTTGERLLTPVASQNQHMVSTLEQKTALFHSPTDMAPGEQRTIKVEVHASSLDATANPAKPPDFHLVGVFKIDITRKRVEDTVTLPSGQSATRERQFDDKQVQFMPAHESHNPGSEAPATQCWPNWTWAEGSPITGSFFAGAKSAPITGQILERDLITLTASGRDVDKIELRCEQIDQCGPASETIELPDTLRYTWYASAGTFVAGANGSSVAFLVPEAPGTMLDIWVEIDDVGGQASDPLLSVPRQTFQILPHRRVINTGVVSTVHSPDIVVPGAQIAVPGPGAGGWLQAPRRLFVPEDGVRHYYRWDAGNLQWERGVNNWFTGGISVQFPEHPWKMAVEGFKASSNPQPPATFADVAALRSWMDVTKEHRHVSAVHAVAKLRRDVVYEILIDDLDPLNRMDAIVDEGWTPTAHASWFERRGAEVITGMSLPPYMRGEFDANRRKIRILDEYTSLAKLRFEDRFRLGPQGNTLQALLTNRDAAWVEAAMTAGIPADRGLIPGDVFSDGDFPTHWIYLDSGSGMNQLYKQFPVATPVFINRGPKIVKEGV